jgi:electron transport complex protein RnfB
MVDDVASVKSDHCMGCGLCTSTCSTGALSLSRKPEDQVRQPPPDVEAMFAQIGKEKGRSMKVQIK